MSVYLHDIPLDKAQARIETTLRERGLWDILAIEEIPLDENAIGRVLGEAIWALISSPNYHASAMDGFTVKATDTVNAAPTAPVRLDYGVQTIYLDTGDVLPDWADAVIPLENVEPLDSVGRAAEDPRHPVSILVRDPVVSWSHVRPMGEDIVATQLVLPAGQILRPVDLAAIAACGHSSIPVTRRPRVAIIPTGSELVDVGSAVKPGEIIEYNSIVIAGQVRDWGGDATRYPITPDDFDMICQRVTVAAQSNDLILVNAGSSAGSEDYTVKVIDALGDVIIHGIAVRPGHPVIFGIISGPGKIVPIFGIPGYPVSAALTGEILIEPLIARWTGRKPNNPDEIEAKLTRKLNSPAGDDDYVRVAIGKVGDEMLAAPLSRGAGVITSLVRADGIVIVPRGSQGLPAGSHVSVKLYRSKKEIERTILVQGSHDLIIDLLAQYIIKYHRRLSSANVGSQAGLVSLMKGEAHLAGSHLLDPSTGEYNISYIEQYLPGRRVILLGLVGREQGLMVAKGNPKQINSLDDLKRDDVIFVNRQRGAGTRVLLDYHLSNQMITPGEIRGYDHEEYTHLAVAVTIASGRYDCGMGITAAAKALDLDFVPLFQERYDLVIPEEYFDSHLIEPLFHVIEEYDFRRAVSSLPGYDIHPMGTIIARIGYQDD